MSNPSSIELALQIDRLMRLIHSELHPRAIEFDHEGVGPIGGMLLLTIGETDPIGLQTVITRMGRDKSQLTRLIQRLQKKGLIEKSRNKDDAREVVLKLTPSGRKQLESIQYALSDVVENIITPLSDDQKADFADLIARILRDK